MSLVARPLNTSFPDIAEDFVNLFPRQSLRHNSMMTLRNIKVVPDTKLRRLLTDLVCKRMSKLG